MPARVTQTVRARVAALAVLAALALMAAGCTGSAGPVTASAPSSPFAGCPPTSTVAVTPRQRALPAVTLPCFTGGGPVALAGLGRPAVINLWASWCGPCRDELPALQAFADEAGDQVVVLGVVTDDVWDRAAWAGIEFGVRFPAVFDPDRTLLRELGRPGLPVTLFVAADGSVRATDVSGALTLEKVRALATEHLGPGS